MPLNPADGANEQEQLVLTFLDLWDRQDVDGMLASFTDDGSYIDMALPPRHGKAAIREYLESIFGAFSVRIETLRIVSSGNVVFTERVDHLALNGTDRRVPLPVTGVMELHDGKIAAWRDYCDVRTAEEGLGIVIRPDTPDGKAIP